MFRSEYGNVCNVVYILNNESWFEVKYIGNDFVIRTMEEENQDIDSVLNILKQCVNKGKYLLYSEPDINSEKYKLVF